MYWGSFLQKIKTGWVWLLLLALALIFFASSSAFNLFSQPEGFVKWTSPDETANYILSLRYAQEGNLTYIEPNNLISKDIIVPRSFRSDFGIVKPVSFLGLILIYGQLASWLGVAVLPFLTPLFAALGLIFFYLLIKEWFDKETALLSTVLLTFFPVYFYYSSRSMFHNVLFIDLLIMGLYCGTLATKLSTFPPRGSLLGDRVRHYATWLAAGLSGGLIGLAIITRTAELLWLGPLLGLIWIFNLKKIGWLRLIIWLYCLGLALLPVLYWNIVLYQEPISTGYPQMTESINTVVESSAEVATSVVQAELPATQTYLQTIFQTVFHFGFQAGHSLKMFYYYYYIMFPWLFWLALIGGLVFLLRYLKDKKHFVYFLAFPIVSIILIFYYGSWVFNDNPDPNSYTIGNSYTRYWLPIYLGSLPLVSLAIVHLTRWLKFNLLINIAKIIIVVGICTWSVYFVLHGSEEGLVPTQKRNLEARSQYELVLGMTEPEAVIITQYHDKLFYPQRKVINGLLTDDNMNREYANLAEHGPVYYYNFSFNSADLDYLNNTKLAPWGLKIETVRQITPDFTLYRLFKE